MTRTLFDFCFAGKATCFGAPTHGDTYADVHTDAWRALFRMQVQAGLEGVCAGLLILRRIPSGLCNLHIDPGLK